MRNAELRSVEAPTELLSLEARLALVLRSFLSIIVQGNYFCGRDPIYRVRDVSFSCMFRDVLPERNLIHHGRDKSGPYHNMERGQLEGRGDDISGCAESGPYLNMEKGSVGRERNLIHHGRDKSGPYPNIERYQGEKYIYCMVKGCEGSCKAGSGTWYGTRKAGRYVYHEGLHKASLHAIAIAIALIMMLFPFATATAHTTVGGSGRISGKLVNGSHKNAPVAGQAVTLQMSQDGSARDLATMKTDAHGSYTFSNLATDSAISYAAYINYRGAQYTSNVVTLDKKPVQQVGLTVYDATNSSSNLAILRSTVLIQEPDAKKSTFTVSELYVFQNLGLQTYVGSLDSSQGKPNALLFSLPKNARGISLDSGFGGYRSLQVAGGFATNTAVPPGESEYSFSFEVPYTASVYDFKYNAQYPTVDFSFMVAPSIHASSGALSAKGIVTANDHPYQLFSGSKLLPNQELHVNFEGLSAPASSSSSLDLKFVWLAVGILILLAIIVTASALSRLPDRKKRRAKGKYAGSKGRQAEKKSGPRSDDRKQELMQELLELDKAYEAGKLSKSAYQERRARTKARLRTFMSEQEATRR